MHPDVVYDRVLKERFVDSIQKTGSNKVVDQKVVVVVHHVVDEVWPFCREVFLSDDGDGRAQLLLHGRRRLEHQIDDRQLDEVAIFRMNLIGFFLKVWKINNIS